MRKRDKNQVAEGNQVVEGNVEVTQKKKKKRKKAPIIIAIMIVIIVIVCAISCSMASNSGVLVTTTTASRGDIQESISTSGMVASGERKVIFAPVGGKIAEVNVAAGDAVSEGTVLISYDMNDAERQLQQMTLQNNKSEAVYQGAMADNSNKRAELSEANRNLAVLEQQLADYKAYLKKLQEELANSKRETNNALANQSYNLSAESADLQKEYAALDQSTPAGAARAAEIEKRQREISSESAYNQYVQQIAGSSDYVASMETEIARVQEQIADFEAYKAEMEAQKSTSENMVLDTYDKQQFSADKDLATMTYEAAQEDYNVAKQGIVAEFDGIVTECTAVQGATVTGGMQLLTLENSNNVKVTFDASKHDVEKLQIGQKADITISGKVYAGEVSKINRMATVNASNTPMVGVEIHILEPDNQIILGLDAKLTVYTNKSENALLIPVEAINADKDGDFLYVVENGVVVKKPIVCGISSDSYTEILEGITQEDQIIVSTLSYTSLEEGMAVTVMPQ